MVLTACGGKKESGVPSANADVLTTSPKDEVSRVHYLETGRTSGEELKLVCTAEFNSEKIPITVFYSWDNDGEYYVTDRFVFRYDGREHSISLDDVSEKFPFSDPGDYGLIEFAADYNFDNYMDAAILSARGVRHSWYDIFIYNPQTKSFFHHKELSAENDIVTDSETKTLHVHGISGHAGLIYTYKKFKWVNDQLTLIYIVNQDYDYDTELYILTTRALQDNGAWTEQKQTFKEEDFD
jgi:hypothetical protein